MGDLQSWKLVRGACDNCGGHNLLGYYDTLKFREQDPKVVGKGREKKLRRSICYSRCVAIVRKLFKS